MKLKELKELNCKKFIAYKKVVTSITKYHEVLWHFKGTVFDTPLTFKDFCYIAHNYTKLNNLYSRGGL